ncbi:MAG: radical SAM protein [Bacillota bacterium]|nr:radical SAM protein [Bacillota bacterium]
MKYYINDSYKYVKGCTGGAIYDLKNGKIYHINQDGCIILEAIMNGDDDHIEKTYKGYTDKLIHLGIIDTKKCDESNYLPLEPKLLYAWLELTDKCNMECIHCYGEFGHAKQKENNYLLKDEWKQILSVLSNYGLKKIQFIGGEPLLYPHFKELLLYANELGFEVDVFTNGYYIDEEIVSLFKKTNTSVRVSIYGYDESSHELITNCKGSFERVDKALSLLKASDVKASTAVVLMKENEEYVERIKGYIQDKGYLFSYDTIRQTCQDSLSKHCLKNVKMLESRYFTRPNFIVTENAFRRNIKWNSCWFGKVAISSTGDILPCTFARNLSCGNIRVNSEIEIGNNLIQYWGLSKDNIEECQICEYRYACHDCRPISMGVNGNIYEKYPRCCYDPGNCEWRDIKEVASFELNNKDSI